MTKQQALEIVACLAYQAFQECERPCIESHSATKAIDIVKVMARTYNERTTPNT